MVFCGLKRNEFFSLYKEEELGCDPSIGKKIVFFT